MNDIAPNAKLGHSWRIVPMKTWLLIRGASRWRRKPWLTTFGIILVCCAAWRQAPAATLEWTRHFGSQAPYTADAVWADGRGSVYVAGLALRTIGGQQTVENFLMQVDEAGDRQWMQLSPANGFVVGAAGDRLGENIYVAGHHEVSFTRNNQVDLSKLNSQGALLWTQQLPPAHRVNATGVAVDDAGSVYLSGYAETEESVQTSGGYVFNPVYAFVTKYDSIGNLEWVKQIDARATAPYSDTFGLGVAVDASGGVYVSGETDGDLGGTGAEGFSAFVQKYDVAGNLQWTRQLGTALRDQRVNVSADDLGNIFIVGQSRHGESGRETGIDTLLAKYDSAGDLLWTKQIGTSTGILDGWSSWGSRVSADGLGNVYLYAYLERSGPGISARTDAYLAKFDGAGSMLWTQEIGNPNAVDVSYDMSADGRGQVYLVGASTGLGTNLKKYVDAVPEPSSLVLVAVTAIGLAPSTHRSRRRTATSRAARAIS